jgi:Zn-dependent peptidase ImmA (M78 family)
MPRSDVLAVLPKVSYFSQIVEAKKRWKVSLAALNYRLHKIGVTTDWKYRDFCIQIVQNHFNVDEPYEIEREKSVVWQKVMTTLWAEKTTQLDIAAALHLPETEVNMLIYGILHTGGNQRPEGGRTLAIVNS